MEKTDFSRRPFFKRLKKGLLLAWLVVLLQSCKTDDPPSDPALYFPPLGSQAWESVTPAALGWDTAAIPALTTLLESNGTRAFILLKDGKIVLEEYFGQNLAGNAPFSQSAMWYWASAGKTLTAFIVGKAQEEGLLSISNKTSDYLGTGWTSLAPAREDLITVRHQLTMTTGLDDGVADSHDFSPANLVYKAPAGTRWAYHNAPYTLLENVAAQATRRDFNGYFNEKLRDRIGMDGFWSWLDSDHVYFSTARSMARFGLLVLNGGKWDQEAVMQDRTFFDQMTRPSQDLNQSYGYLWWLNGKGSFMVPGSQAVIPGSLNPNAPADMVSGLGKNGQYVSVVPSLKLVLVRMGENPDAVEVPFLFLDEIWKKLNMIIK